MDFLLLAAAQTVPQVAAQPVPQAAAKPVTQAEDAATTLKDQQSAIEFDASDWRLTDQEWAAISRY